MQVSLGPYTSPIGKTDEAHSTAGDLGRPWAAIHDNARIPADFRLYLTATPRILAAPQPRRGADGQEAEIATMADDPDGTFGAWLPGAELGLSEAIERGILAGFEIDVLEIRDPRRSSVSLRRHGGAGVWPCCRPRSWSTSPHGTCAPS
ncbi:hypothetical protein GCM10010377_77540 [Streptomyces viridiviolaceus]|nr:hypothetical protein GCM10010377_77540 [Streptomyces viridiviolaceus]